MTAFDARRLESFACKMDAAEVERRMAAKSEEEPKVVLDLAASGGESSSGETEMGVEEAIVGVKEFPDDKRIAALRCICKFSSTLDVGNVACALRSVLNIVAADGLEPDVAVESVRAAGALFARHLDLLPAERCLSGMVIGETKGVSKDGSWESLWELGRSLKDRVIGLWEMGDERVRTEVVKFAETATLAESRSTHDSDRWGGGRDDGLLAPPTDCADQFLSDAMSCDGRKKTPPFPARVEKDAKEFLRKLLELQSRRDTSGVNLLDVLNAVTDIARKRPAFFSLILDDMQRLNRTLPWHRADEEVVAIRKHMKANTMTLLKLPAAFQHLPEIRALLNELGATNQEMRLLWKCFLRRKSTGGSYRVRNNTHHNYHHYSSNYSNHNNNNNNDDVVVTANAADVVGQKKMGSSPPVDKTDLKLLRSRSFPNSRRGYCDNPNVVSRFAAMIEGEDRELSFEEWVELANEMRRTRWGTITVSCSADFPPALEVTPETEPEPEPEVTADPQDSGGAVVVIPDVAAVGRIESCSSSGSVDFDDDDADADVGDGDGDEGEASPSPSPFRSPSPSPPPTPSSVTSSLSSSSQLVSPTSTSTSNSASSGSVPAAAAAPASVASVASTTTTTTTNSAAERKTYTSKMKLLTEGDVLVCKMENKKKPLQKFFQSKLLYRWERHRLALEESCVMSRSPGGFMASPIRYSVIEEVSLVPAPHSNGHKHLVCIAMHDGSYFLKTSSAYLRDQWLQSISSRRCMFKYQQIFRCATRPEIKCREVRNMVQHVLSSPVQDTAMVCHVINGLTPWLPPTIEDDILQLIAPLLVETTHQPSKTLCSYFSDYCHRNPRSVLIPQLLAGVVEWILKRNADFGKHPYMRKLVQDFLGSIYGQNNGRAAVEEFVARLHGPSSVCPHPRIMLNLVTVCLASLHNAFAQNKLADVEESSLAPAGSKTGWDHFNYSLDVLRKIAGYADWRPGLAQILQPVPFCPNALTSPTFLRRFGEVLTKIACDPRCAVHQLVLGIRDGKDGWFDVFCPARHADDEGIASVWVDTLSSLFNCCCRRKKFVSRLVQVVGVLELLALRDTAVAQEVLCFMLEYDMVDGEESQMQLVTTLESVQSGRDAYARLLERRSQLLRLRQRGGPRKLIMPSKCTDEDLARLLDSGSFGNLECLSLAFTNVTSACAEHLAKFLSLRYLNLWATRFGDSGLELICEHLDRLQVLNLCETPVTDKGLQCLASVKSLKRLNLNSTWLSLSTFELLKRCLPELEEIDVRYTDAWR